MSDDATTPSYSHFHKDNKDYFNFNFTGEEIKMLDERRANRISGKSKKYSWEEARKIITGNRKI